MMTLLWDFFFSERRILFLLLSVLVSPMTSFFRFRLTTMRTGLVRAKPFARVLVLLLARSFLVRLRRTTMMMGIGDGFFMVLEIEYCHRKCGQRFCRSMCLELTDRCNASLIRVSGYYYEFPTLKYAKYTRKNFSDSI